MLKEASREIFTGLAGSYDRVLDCATFFQDRAWKRWVARRLAADPPGLVLDVGCGTLVLEERLSGMGHRFVGLDLSKEMLQAGRGKAMAVVSLLVRGDAESLPFPDHAFDSVVSCYVPKYVQASKFSRELARVSRPRAGVVIYDFARPRGAAAPLLNLYVQGGLRLVGAALRKAGREEAATFEDLPWIVGGTAWDREVPRAMEESGFRTLETARLTGGAVFAYWGRRG